MDGELIAATAPTMSSREIADLVESRHDKVKQSIERLADRGVIVRPPMGDEHFTDAMGRPRSEAVYKLGKRDPYVVVAQLSPEFTARLVDRWQELESRLTAPALVPDLSDPAVLTTLLLEHAGKRIEAEQRAITAERIVQEVRPKADFYDAFLNAEGLYGLQNGGRALNLRPNLFIRWLKTKYLFYQGTDLVPYVQYRQADIFDVRTEIIDDKKRLQSYITPKGLAYLNERVPAHIRIKQVSE